MDVLQGVTLLAATIATGLMAGVFAIYSNAIMPGLRRTDDRTFVGAISSTTEGRCCPGPLPPSCSTWLCS
jgi:uncharacterized membrane protein